MLRFSPFQRFGRRRFGVSRPPAAADLARRSSLLQCPTFLTEARPVYAIIEDSGTQIKVSPGDELDLDPRDLGGNKTITFDRVLLVGDTESDEAATIGTPYIDGATVSAEVLGEIRGKKIDVVRFKRRKGYKRKTGHRQPYLRVRIGEIEA
jgi:large subunit ribosomal protein L21